MSDETRTPDETLRQAMLHQLDAQEKLGLAIDKLFDFVRTSARDSAAVVGKNTAAVERLIKTVEDAKQDTDTAIAELGRRLDAKGA